MNEKSIRSVERIYKRRFIIGIIISVITLAFFLVSFINSEFIESIYRPISDNVADQFGKGFTNILNIIIFVLLLMVPLISAIMCRLRKKVGLKLGSIYGIIIAVCGMIGLFKIGFAPYGSSGSASFLYLVTSFGIAVFVYYAIIGLFRLNIMRARMIGKAKPNMNAKTTIKTDLNTNTDSSSEYQEVLEDYSTTDVYTDNSYNESTDVSHSEESWGSYKEY